MIILKKIQMMAISAEFPSKKGLLVIFLKEINLIE